jgi:uncharacterized delta-60 repeat protein
MAIQADGKIVLVGRVWPEAAALARLNPDGSVDRSFGQEGFVLDHRLPGLRAVALAPEGRIVAAALGGANLARYLPDGDPDTAFGADGVGGLDEPEQPHEAPEHEYGPVAVVAQPDGDLVVAGIRVISATGIRDIGENGSEAWVRRFDASGALVETVGRVPKPGPVSWSRISDLVEAPDGSLIGAGSMYSYESKQREEPVLARFLPGSGSDFDKAFGGGVAVLRPPLPVEGYYGFDAVAAVRGGALAAGHAEDSFLIARFGEDGRLDSSFGEGGFVVPATGGGSAWAEDVAVTGDGGIVAGGGALPPRDARKEQAVSCVKCPRPLLARFDASGRLDASFGEGGLLQLRDPDGREIHARVEQVSVLPDGKLLVAGSPPIARWRYSSFVARLNPDGAYDRTFGQEGLVHPPFPCSDTPGAFHHEPGCVSSLRVRLHLFGRGSQHPSLSVSVRTGFAWSGLGAIALTLPEGLRLAPRFKQRLRVRGAAERVRIRGAALKPGSRGPVLFLERLGEVREVRLRMRPGSLVPRAQGPRQAHPRYKVWAQFLDPRWDLYAGQASWFRRG